MFPGISNFGVPLPPAALFSQATPPPIPPELVAQQGGLKGAGRQNVSSQLGNGWEGLQLAPEAGRTPDFGWLSGSDQRDSLPDNTPLSQLNDEQRQTLFSDSGPLMKDLGQSRPHLTVGQMLPLSRNPGTLQNATELLTRRPDLQLSDLMSRDRNGQEQVSSLLGDDRLRKLMMNNPSLKPAQLSTLRRNLAGTLKNPALAKEAFKHATELMEARPDITPENLDQLMGKIVSGTGAGSKKGSEGPAAALSMFKKSTEMMKSGKAGLEDVGRLVETSAKVAGGDQPGSANQVADAFEAGAEKMEKNPAAKSEDIARMADVTSKRFPDSKNSADGVSAFRKGLETSGSNPGLGAKGVDAMLAKGEEKGLKGGKLLNAFDSQTSALQQGTATSSALTDRQATPETEGNVKLDQDGRGESAQREAVGQGTSPKPSKTIPSVVPKPIPR